VSECIATRTTVSLLNQTAYNADVAELGGFRVFTWQDGSSGADAEGVIYGGVFASVQDAATGTFLIENQKLSSLGANPRVVTGGTAANPSNIFTVLWYVPNSPVGKGVNGTITACTWAPTTVTTFTSPVVLRFGVAPLFDVCPIVGDTTFSAWVLVFSDRPGSVDQPVIAVYNSGTTLHYQTAATATTSTTIRSIAVRATYNGPSDNLLWLSFALLPAGSGGTTTVWWLSAGYSVTGTYTPSAALALFTSTAQQAFNIGIERADASHAYIVLGLGTPVTGSLPLGAPNQTSLYEVSTSAVVLSPAKPVGYNLTPISKPFLVGNRLYVYGHINDDFASGIAGGTQVLADLQLGVSVFGDSEGYIQPRPVATVAPRTAGNFGTTLFGPFGVTFFQVGPQAKSHLSAVTNPGNIAAGTYRTCGSVISADGIVGFNAATSVLLDFTAPGRWINFEIGDSLFVNGGVPGYYDGGQLVEAGYFIPPAKATSVVSSSGIGNLQTNTTYSYVFLWEWLDSKGQVHRGIASPVFQVSTAGVATPIVTWNLPTLPMTWRQGVNLINGSPVWLVPYRTQFANGAMGSTFFRLFPGAVPTPDASLISSVQGYGTTFIDNTPDAGIGINPVWLGSAGVVESQCPSSFVSAWKYNDRVFGIGDDTKTIWYSNQTLEGEPPLFNDGFTFTLSTLGPLTAGAQMDSNNIIFSATGLGYFTGEGPNNTNTQSDFTPFQQLTSDVGCIDPRSVVLMPAGLMFQSARGIYLLTRALDLQYIGKNVENVLAQYPVITSAVLIPGQNEVRFTCCPVGATASSQGVTVRYNYLFDAWSTDQIYNVTGPVSSCAFQTAAVVSGAYYCGALNEQVYQESPTFFMDAGTYVNTTVASSWLRPSGINGWGRTWRTFFLGDELDAHDLTISFAYDYSATTSQSYTWTWPVIQRFQGMPIERVRMDVGQQKASAIQVTITDQTPTGGGATTGQGVRFVGLTAEMGIYPGNYRLPAAQRG
jgi:hypothetical protein